MPHLALKRALGKVWPIRSNSRKIVLLYHSVGDTPWGMRKSIFNEQVNWLSDNCRVLSLTDLIHAKPCEDIQVAITFDDGYVTLYDQVAEKLAENKLSAMVYINTGWIGEDQNSRRQSVAKLGHYPDESFLIWQEVKALHQAGWEVGSHGVNHYNFAQTEFNMMQQELLISKKHIEEYLKIDCLHFAYPWGRYSDRVKESVSQTGYLYGAGAYHAPLNSRSDLLALPRINIPLEYSFADFKNVVVGKWDYLGLLHRMRGL